MQNLIIRAVIIFLGALLQISFLSGIFSVQNIPFILVSYVVALTIIREFKFALPWVIGIALVFDLLSYRIPGESVIPLVLIAYMVSFISRKIWLENKFWSRVAVSLLVSGGAIFSYVYYLFLQIFLGQMDFSGWFNIFIFEYHHILLSAVYSVAILFIIYWPLEKLEAQLSFFERKTILNR
jgi:hypothetical protein